MFVTLDGDYVCPSSLPGEAAVHRVADRLPRSPSANWVRPAAQAGLGFLSGRLVGNLIFGGRSQGMDPSQAAQNISRTLRP
jgi:hypothetical protein